MSIIDGYELDELFDIKKAAKEWSAARLAVCNSKINTEECSKAIIRLGHAEDALSKLVNR